MIVFVAGLFRFLVLLFIVRLVLRGVASLLAPARVKAPTAPAPSPKTAVDLVRDRICNTFLPRSRAIRALVAGEEQLFCSAECAHRAQTL